MQQQSLQVRNVVSEIVGMDALQDVHLSAFLLCPADRQPCGNALERENPSNMSIHLVYLYKDFQTGLTYRVSSIQSLELL